MVAEFQKRILCCRRINASEEWMNRVRLGSINRVSGSDGGYYDGTSMSVNMKRV